MDGIEELKGVLVLGATNRLDILDPAILRAGRFDEIFEIPMPTEQDRIEIFGVHLRNKPLEKGINPEWLASQTEGFGGADIAGICQKAALKAVRRAVESLKQNPDAKIKVKLTKDDLLKTLDEVSE
jgi:transitional endoplasmic reticulum ATPase